MNIANFIFSRMNSPVLRLTLACLQVMPATAQVNYVVDGSTAYVTNSPGASGNVVIASIYNGYPVTGIGHQAFAQCYNLSSVTIPDSVTSIGIMAFYRCLSLSSVTIPNSVTSIGSFAFGTCDSLTSATIPNSVTNIGQYTFDSCTSLASVTIGNSITNLGGGAFVNCYNLTSVTIPDNVTSIEAEEFSGCIGLTNVTIPNSVISIGYRAFSGCTSLTSVTIPNSVTSIGESAFVAAGLASVTIPESVTSIEYRAFSSCMSLTNLLVDAANSVFSSLDGVLFNKAQTMLIQFPGGRGGSYAISNGVISIGEAAFYHCLDLTSAIIPNSVTSVGNSAFSYCPNLANLTFLGNAPFEGADVFYRSAVGVKVYYYYGTTGWEPTYGGLPTVMLGAPAPQVGAGSAGVKQGGFGFTLNGVINQTIVVEASTNLVNWQLIWTRTLSAVSTNFVDPDWVNHPHRFYRLQSN